MARPAEMRAVPWRIVAPRVILRVRLTPKSSRDAVDGREARADGPVLKARVRAVPEDGKANDALVRLIADWLDVPVRTVSVAGGQTARTKSVAIVGDPAVVAARLETLLPPT